MAQARSPYGRQGLAGASWTDAERLHVASDSSADGGVRRYHARQLARGRNA